MKAVELARINHMEPHVEGGSFVEIYKDRTHRGEGRAAHGVIYYQLGSEEFSEFHVLDCDEYWMWHAGTPLEVWTVNTSGELRIELLGVTEGAQPCLLLEKGEIFGARHLPGAEDGTFVSCVTVPEFTYEHYRILPKEEMISRWPETSGFYRD